MAGCTTLGLHCFQICMGGQLCVVVSHLSVVHMAVRMSCQAMTSGVVDIRCGCCVLSVCICNLRGDIQNVLGTAFQHWYGLGLALHLSIASFLFIGVLSCTGEVSWDAHGQVWSPQTGCSIGTSKHCCKPSGGDAVLDCCCGVGCIMLLTAGGIVLLGLTSWGYCSVVSLWHCAGSMAAPRAGRLSTPCSLLLALKQAATCRIMIGG